MKNGLWITCLLLAAPSTVFAGQTISAVEADSWVTVSGIVHQITDEDTFVLKDHTGQIPVYIGPNRMPVQQGMPVTVHGVVDDDFPREIYAKRIDGENGQSHTLDHQYD
ncbi:NirD/YgiW/YdeI family stress tolerance protein [Roseobacter weihaiensis]|uniref:NirD/YgiW/YdeI family stress tolerance protein n=1 Tax=Roseobacter weihaiensis TaxID=2763262 RepID=UPI001D0B1E1B|nr:NirD/YgiW/YdeI family stress tolerance protein [Roseobacter sp. H9]